MFMTHKVRPGVWAIIILILLAGIGFYTINHTRVFRNSPNIIIILTDDVDLKLMPYVPKTNELIGEQGATLTNYFITTPICCPSRSSMLRGQYAHNTDVLENSPGFVRFFRLNEEAETLAVWLSRDGYQTSLIGKYLNSYPTNAGKNYIPAGWTDWHSFIYQRGNNDFYYNYIMNENAELVSYGDAPEEYSTDVIRDKSISFINQNAAEGSPFFLLISVYGAHGPSTPAPRHEDLFADLQYPQSPSFNEEDISDKPQVIQQLGSTGDEFDAYDANALFRKRAQSMQSVDELVADVMQTLEKNGQLENTYVIFTSDNGFHMGEHRVPSGKGMPYEEDIRVPFLIRGPGIPAGMQISQMIANIDLAPTIADWTDTRTADFVDGRSFAPFLDPAAGPLADWRKGLLIEIGYTAGRFSSNTQNIAFDPSGSSSMIEYPDSKYDNYLAEEEGATYRGIRGENFVYSEYENGEIEFYDLTTDPYELNNIAATIDPGILAQLHAQLELLKTCTAETCRTVENEIIPNPNKLK
jgi:N-acetylglucosamine-6-sulfatase